ncbi:MAG: hypothetical protein WAV09_03330 [Minisyncoccia bacterium]
MSSSRPASHLTAPQIASGIDEGGFSSGTTGSFSWLADIVHALTRNAFEFTATLSAV